MANGAASRGNRTALIVEDELMLALDMADLVRESGFEPLSAVASGEEALRSVATRQPGVVLMDVRLRGEMDGVEAARVISERWAVPVVFISAYADATMVARMQKVLPVAILRKPVDRERLAGVLSAVADAQDTADHRN